MFLTVDLAKCSTRIFSFSWPQMATDIVGDALSKW